MNFCTIASTKLRNKTHSYFSKYGTFVPSRLPTRAPSHIHTAINHSMSRSIAVWRITCLVNLIHKHRNEYRVYNDTFVLPQVLREVPSYIHTINSYEHIEQWVYLI